MNTTIRGHNLRVRVVMALLALLLVLAVALLFALQPTPTTSDRDAKPANHAMSGTRASDVSDVTHLIPTSGSDANPTIDAVSGTGESSISQNPDVKRHAEVVARLGNGSLR
jgi:hypothetical protein